MFLAGTALMEEVGLEDDDSHTAAREAFNRNSVVNVNGSFIATSDTYKARAAAAAMTSQRW